MTGESILIVEDEGLIALHMTEMLEKAGYRVTGPASSGEMVLSKFLIPPMPDLVLMDIALAGKLDGIETARQIRQQFPALPLIFVTAYSPERTLERLQDLEPDGIIVKPFEDTDLLSLMKKALRR
jgi:two-component system, response regulator PdtaR